MEWAYPFQSSGLRHVNFSSVFSCPRWSRTTAGDVSDRYASVTTPDSREGGSRTRGLVLPRHATHPFLFLPLSVLRCSDPCGIRTQPLQLERLTTSPEVERAVVVPARTLSAVGREALESSSAAFQATAKPSQLPTHDSLLDFLNLRFGQQKKPDVLATPGFY